MDPETNFDGVRNVGIIGGKIASITTNDISGKETINAKGLVVCPGFIEGHVHGNDPFAFKALVRDGLTTAMDFEAGIGNVSGWYTRKQGKTQINYGQVACAAFARLAVLDGEDLAALGDDPAGITTHILPAVGKRAKEEGRPMGWNATLPDKLQMSQIMALLDDQLRQGALGIGVPVAYMTHGVTSYEMYKYQELAGLYDRITNAHTRFSGVMPPASGALGIQELLSNAMVLGAPTMIAHINSTQDWEFTTDYVNKARNKAGAKVFAEAYPYHAASTIGASDILTKETMENMGMSVDKIYYVDPYQRWDDEIHAKRFEKPGSLVVFENNKEEDIWKWMKDPETLVCSDAMPVTDAAGETYPWDTPFEGKTCHPRTSGTRGKFLRMLREDLKDHVSLMTGIAKMAYLPAKYFEEIGGIPHFRTKGRLQEGCDADIVVLDPETVTDNSSYNVGEGMLPTTGIPYVLVNGTVVVKDSEVLPVFPGQPIRFPTMPKGKIDQLTVDPPFRPGMGKNTRHIEHLNLGCC